MAESLVEARETLLDNLIDGSLNTCPCCDQDAKIYKRKLVETLITEIEYKHSPNATNWMRRDAGL